jgi:hypothetical protein
MGTNGVFLIYKLAQTETAHVAKTIALIKAMRSKSEKSSRREGERKRNQRTTPPKLLFLHCHATEAILYIDHFFYNSIQCVVFLIHSTPLDSTVAGATLA